MNYARNAYATPKQTAYLKALVAERVMPEGDASTGIIVSDVIEGHPVKKWQASEAISVLVKQPKQEV